jgi:hypothetical protein
LQKLPPGLALAIDMLFRKYPKTKPILQYVASGVLLLDRLLGSLPGLSNVEEKKAKK